MPSPFGLRLNSILVASTFKVPELKVILPSPRLKSATDLPS